ncbi:MAG: hypothetical protein BA863_10440 [Desulfovibrio sp. S3730MH75]|nr:MAG: hypothetical protein BA863_10440 [Desulfovibrio sp. S3730MH75]
METPNQRKAMQMRLCSAAVRRKSKDKTLYLKFFLNLTDVGFEPDDEVVVIAKRDFHVLDDYYKQH